MAEDWQVGDKALCIESGVKTRKGATYTVRAVLPVGGRLIAFLRNPGPHPALRFHEVSYRPCFWSGGERFRKIRPDEPKACEEEFRILLKLSKQRVLAQTPSGEK